MLLKGGMRRKQASKMCCLAEGCHGESHEACIAPRESGTLTYLACNVSQSTRNRTHPAGIGTDAERRCSYAEVIQANLSTLYRHWGAAERGKGNKRTRHLQHPVRVLHDEHGKPFDGCQGQWRVAGRQTTRQSANTVKGWRMGRSSLRTGKPSTRAQKSQRSPMAKAPSFLRLRMQR
jgi:hypothetical protein